MPKQDDEAGELGEAEEVDEFALPSGLNSSEVLEPGEKPFDLPAAFIPA